MSSPGQRCPVSGRPPPWGTKWSLHSASVPRNRFGSNAWGSSHVVWSRFVATTSSSTRRPLGKAVPAYRVGRVVTAASAGTKGASRRTSCANAVGDACHDRVAGGCAPALPDLVDEVRRPPVADDALAVRLEVCRAGCCESVDDPCHSPCPTDLHFRALGDACPPDDGSSVRLDSGVVHRATTVVHPSVDRVGEQPVCQSEEAGHAALVHQQVDEHRLALAVRLAVETVHGAPTEEWSGDDGRHRPFPAHEVLVVEERDAGRPVKDGATAMVVAGRRAAVSSRWGRRSGSRRPGRDVRRDGS